MAWVEEDVPAKLVGNTLRNADTRADGAELGAVTDMAKLNFWNWQETLSAVYQSVRHSAKAGKRSLSPLRENALFFRKLIDIPRLMRRTVHERLTLEHFRDSMLIRAAKPLGQQIIGRSTSAKASQAQQRQHSQMSDK